MTLLMKVKNKIHLCSKSRSGSICIYADVVNFYDTNGSLIEHINMFMIKDLLKKEESAAPGTLNTHSNNKQPRTEWVHVNNLRRYKSINCHHLSKFVNSVIPIITKCNPKKNYDIYEIMISLIS